MHACVYIYTPFIFMTSIFKLIVVIFINFFSTQHSLSLIDIVTSQILDFFFFFALFWGFVLLDFLLVLVVGFFGFCWGFLWFFVVFWFWVFFFFVSLLFYLFGERCFTFFVGAGTSKLLHYFGLFYYQVQ